MKGSQTKKGRQFSPSVKKEINTPFSFFYQTSNKLLTKVEALLRELFLQNEKE
jgi:hypothetical protein